jgi:hypothetical protein
LAQQVTGAGVAVWKQEALFAQQAGLSVDAEFLPHAQVAGWRFVPTKEELAR